MKRKKILIQRFRLLRLFKSKKLVSLEEIIALIPAIAQYNARIYELRHIHWYEIKNHRSWSLNEKWWRIYDSVYEFKGKKLNNPLCKDKNKSDTNHDEKSKRKISAKIDFEEFIEWWAIEWKISGNIKYNQ